MPEVEVERRLLCGTCGHAEESHKPEYTATMCRECYDSGNAEMGASGEFHHFDGVPYVRCPECRGSGRYLLQRLYGDDVIEREESCPSCSGPGVGEGDRR